MVQAINPRARCRLLDAPGSSRPSWEFIIDAQAEPAPEPAEARFVALSTVSRFQLEVS